MSSSCVTRGWLTFFWGWRESYLRLSARIGQLLSAAGLDPVCLGNVVEKSRGIGIGGCVVTWEVGFLPEIEVAMMGTVVREILKRVRRWIYESVKIRVSNFTRGQIVDWIGWAMGILSSWGSYGGLMDGVVWASVGHAPDYVRDAVDIEKRGIEGDGLFVWGVLGIRSTRVI